MESVDVRDSVVPDLRLARSGGVLAEGGADGIEYQLSRPAGGDRRRGVAGVVRRPHATGDHRSHTRCDGTGIL